MNITIHEILEYEKTNPLLIRLHPEGTFWKAFDMSAFLFAKYVKAYTPVKKYSTTLNCKFTSIGFPLAGLNKILRTANYRKVNDTLYEIYPPIPQDHIPTIHQEYEAWLESITLTRPKIQPTTNPQNNAPLYSDSEQDVITQLLNFNLQNASPLDCVFLLSNLQQQLLRK